MTALVREEIRFSGGEPFRLLQWRGHSKLLDSLQPDGGRVPVRGIGDRWHSHPELELDLVTRGSGTRYVGDHVGAFEAMDCVLVGAMLPHCWVERGRYDGYVLQFRLPPEHFVWRLAGAAALRALLGAARRGRAFDRETASGALKLVGRMAEGSALGRAGLLLELLAHLHARLERHSVPLARSGLGAVADSGSRSRLEETVQWVLESFTGPLSLETAVQRSAMSRATFCRQFRRHTGKTFSRFVNDARLAYAHQLVTTTARPINQIAVAAGFGNLSGFNATFRSKFGATPRAVRRSPADG